MAPTSSEPPVKLTRRERQVVALIAASASNEAIALQLGLTIKTVEFHLTNIFRKTKTGTRTELALRFAGRLGGAGV